MYPVSGGLVSVCTCDTHEWVVCVSYTSPLPAHRLACYEDFVEQIPEELSTLLPTEPHPVFKYSPDDGTHTRTHTHTHAQ